jgi:hypothetical protein
MTISGFDTPVMLLLHTHTLPPAPHAPHACTMPTLALAPLPSLARMHATTTTPHSHCHRTLNPRVPAPRRTKLHPRRLLGLRALGPHKSVQDNTPLLASSEPSLSCSSVIKRPNFSSSSCHHQDSDHLICSHRHCSQHSVPKISVQLRDLK